MYNQKGFEPVSLLAIVAVIVACSLVVVAIRHTRSVTNTAARTKSALDQQLKNMTPPNSCKVAKQDYEKPGFDAFPGGSWHVYYDCTIDNRTTYEQLKERAGSKNQKITLDKTSYSQQDGRLVYGELTLVQNGYEEGYSLTDFGKTVDPGVPQVSVLLRKK